MSEPYDLVAIADDLRECRARGLDWLDHRQTNQKPVSAAELQRLAEAYIEARKLFAVGRIAKIKILLEQGIAELERQGQPSNANLLKDLFFGDGSQATIGMRAGDLLEFARRKAGESEARFRERRRNLMNMFAGFLVTVTVNAGREEQARRVPPPEKADSGTRLLATGFVGDNEQFVQMLAAASKATIIGMTNERLLPMLTEALARKRLTGGPDAFWESLRIVFLSESLLGAINDEREVLHDRDAAWRQRCHEAFWARRFISVFFRRTHPSGWELFESSYLPEITGSLLEFGDGKVAHLLMRRPRRPTADHLYVDLEDRANHFSGVFEDIVRSSASDNMLVPVGMPAGQTFKFSGRTRPRADVLRDLSSESGWLPMILVIMYRRRDGQAEPVLQLRTAENAAREENRLSHIGGHILQADVLRAVGPGWADLSRPLELADETPVKAAERLAENMTGIDATGALRPVATGRYLYPDKEHLFFFVYTQELPDDVSLPRRAELRPFSLSRLLTIRADQVLGLAAQLCRAIAIPEDARITAAEILALNLTLHGRRDLAEELRGLAGRAEDERAVAAEYFDRQAAGLSAPSWASGNRDVPLRGLAGWQYREFFSVMLPEYASVGVPGAADLIELIEGDKEMQSARDQLARLYQDEDLIRVMPFEL